MKAHVVSLYDEELRRFRARLTTMGKLTVEQLDSAMGAIDRLDVDLATRVIEREPDADRLEHQIDNLAVRVIALRQPVATDLRRILSALWIANELERICDHAEDMAQRFLSPRGPQAPTAARWSTWPALH